jgi:hypothetical protein
MGGIVPPNGWNSTTQWVELCSQQSWEGHPSGRAGFGLVWSHGAAWRAAARGVMVRCEPWLGFTADTEATRNQARKGLRRGARSVRTDPKQSAQAHNAHNDRYYSVRGRCKQARSKARCHSQSRSKIVSSAKAPEWAPVRWSQWICAKVGEGW